jgi:DNA-directed RNA polymerase specialized sigma24 family protein
MDLVSIDPTSAALLDCVGLSPNKNLDDLFDAEIVAGASARAQARVEPQTWEAFRLTAYERLSGDIVAARLGMSRATVFTAKSRVLEFLREEINRLDGP